MLKATHKKRTLLICQGNTNQSKSNLPYRPANAFARLTIHRPRPASWLFWLSLCRPWRPPSAAQSLETPTEWLFRRRPLRHLAADALVTAASAGTVACGWCCYRQMAYVVWSSPKQKHCAHADRERPRWRPIRSWTPWRKICASRPTRIRPAGVRSVDRLYK